MVSKKVNTRPSIAGNGQPGLRLPRRHRTRGGAEPILALLPALIAMTLVQIGPMLVGVVMAFFRLTQFTIGNWLEAPFAGLQNITLAVNPTEPIGREFWGSMGLTALYTVLVVGIAWVFGMAGAVFLSDQFRGRGLLRSLFILPYAIPAYAGVMIWTFMFQSNGAINTLLGRDLHLLSSQTFWLSGAKAFGAILVAGVWQMWPFAFLMLLAGIQGVPGELYEAARVDGATRWTEFRDITLPVTRDVSRVLVLITGLWTFNNFTTPYVMFGNAPPASTNLVSLQIYINSFVDLNFGLGAAMAVIMIAILVIIALLYIRLLRLNVGEVPNG